MLHNRCMFGLRLCITGFVRYYLQRLYVFDLLLCIIQGRYNRSASLCYRIGIFGLRLCVTAKVYVRPASALDV